MNTRILPLTLALFALTVISKAEPPPIIQPIAIVWDATGNAMEQISTRLIAYIEQRAVNYPT